MRVVGCPVAVAQWQSAEAQARGVLGLTPGTYATVHLVVLLHLAMVRNALLVALITNVLLVSCCTVEPSHVDALFQCSSG